MSNSYSAMTKRLAKYRELLSLTQQQVSEMLEISQSNYSKIELEKIYISGPALCKLYASGWDIDYIMTGEERAPLGRMIQQELKISDEEENKPLFTLFCWAVRNRVKEHTISEGAKRELELLQIMNELTKKESVMYCARKMLNMSQTEIADRLVICIKNYREIERGSRKPDGHLLFDIMEMTKYRPTLFLNEQGIQWNIMNYILDSMDDGARGEILQFIKSGMNLVKNQ